MTENDQDDGFEPPADHLAITTDPYLGVERRENALAIRREGKSIVVDETNVVALVAALETLREQAHRPDPSPVGDWKDITARSASTAGEDTLGDTDADGDGRECPECGADVFESLGGPKCPECGWYDSGTDKEDYQ